MTNTLHSELRREPPQTFGPNVMPRLSEPVPSPLRAGERRGEEETAGGNADRMARQYAQSRDPKLREQLIQRHSRLVYALANRFVGRGELLEDLIQIGMLGLIQAVDRFDPSRDTQFSTFAVPTIVGEIKRHLRDKTWHVKVPRWLQERSQEARKARLHLLVDLNRTPTVAEIAAYLAVSEKETQESLDIYRLALPFSLDHAPSASGEGRALEECVGAQEQAFPCFELHYDLRRAVQCLGARERHIVHLHFFDELPQSQIARLLGISQMQVSRLLRHSLHLLRHILTDDTPAPRTRSVTKSGLIQNPMEMKACL